MLNIIQVFFNIVDIFSGYYEDITNRNANKDGYFLILVGSFLCVFSGIFTYIEIHTIFICCVFVYTGIKSFYFMYNNPHIVESEAYKYFVRHNMSFVIFIKIFLCLSFIPLFIFGKFDSLILSYLFYILFDTIGYLFLISNPTPPTRKYHFFKKFA